MMIVLPNGQKECLITNLPANKFPPETLKKLYCIRWKIETSFRLIKYSANLLNFIQKNRVFATGDTKMIFFITLRPRSPNICDIKEIVESINISRI